MALSMITKQTNTINYASKIGYILTPDRCYILIGENGDEILVYKDQKEISLNKNKNETSLTFIAKS